MQVNLTKSVISFEATEHASKPTTQISILSHYSPPPPPGHSYLVLGRSRPPAILLVLSFPVTVPRQAVQTPVRQQTTHVAGQVGQTVPAAAVVEPLLRHLARRIPGDVAAEDRKLPPPPPPPLPLLVIFLVAGPRSSHLRAPATRVPTQITRTFAPSTPREIRPRSIDQSSIFICRLCHSVFVAVASSRDQSTRRRCFLEFG